MASTSIRLDPLNINAWDAMSEITQGGSDAELTPSPVPTVKSVETRFLYPFAYQRDASDAAASALRTLSLSTRDGGEQPLWACAGPYGQYSEPLPQYQDELLDHVLVHLFPTLDPNFQGDGANVSGYLRLSPVAANKWFQGTRLTLAARKNGKTVDEDFFTVEHIPDIGIEVFLSPQGIGVLSVGLRPGREGLSLEQVHNFNYRLAQYRRAPVPRFHKSHPSENPQQYDRIPAEKRSSIAPAPGDDAPLTQRLGAAGGSFDLCELIAWILAPLEAHGMAPVETDLKELIVYTVARFGPGVDFGNLDGKGALGRFLSGLAQGEEPRHAGAAPGPLSIPNVLLNANHWVAVGMLGAAHLVVDQPPEGADKREVEFNSQKVPILRDKYFIPYLIALLQRLTLNRATEEAIELLSKAGKTPAKELQGLRQQLLEFAISGHFSQVSRRHALHRFYQTARVGLDVPDAWDEVRRSISDIDATYSARRLEQVAEETTALTKGMHGSLDFMAHAQEIVELVEIFLVSVYAAHLTHMLAWEEDPLRGLYVATSAALGAVVTAYFAAKKKGQMARVGLVAAFLYLAASAFVVTTIPLPSKEKPEHPVLEIPRFHAPTGEPYVIWGGLTLLVLGVIFLLCLRRAFRAEPVDSHPKGHSAD